MRRLILIKSILIFLLIVGCGGGGNGDTADSEDQPFIQEDQPFIQIVSPAAGSSVDGLPVYFVIHTGGLVDYTKFQAELDNGSEPVEPLTGYFGHHPEGNFEARKRLLAPDTYIFRASIVDLQGGTLSDAVRFTVGKKPDLEVLPGTVITNPRKPIVNQPIDFGLVVKNRGPVKSPETSLEIACVFPGGIKPPIDLGYRPVPALDPMEVFKVREDLPGLTEPCTLRVEVDPDSTVDESDESNNITEKELEPGQPSDLDLGVRIEALGSLVTEQTVSGSPSIRFMVEVRNIGNQSVQYPKLRFSLKDQVSGAYLGSNFGALPGGGSGACSDGSFPNEPVWVLQSLAAGESRMTEFTTGWDSTRTNGWIELCVEVSASDNSNPVNWAPLAEIDQMANNSVTADWDMNRVGDFPVNGQITMEEIAFFDVTDPYPADGGMPLQHGDGASKSLRLKLRSASPGDVGLVSVETAYTARGGKDDGRVARSLWRLHEFIYPDTYLVIPLPHGGPLPGTPNLDLTVTVTSGCTTLDLPFRACSDGQNGPLLLSKTVTIPVEYKDVAISGISLSPPEPYTHTVPAGGDPIQAIAHVTNLGLDPAEVDVEMEVTGVPAASGSQTELGVLPGSPKRVTLPVSGTVEVPFDWSPTHGTSPASDLDRYELTARVLPVDTQWPGSDGDNRNSEFFPVPQLPDLTVYHMVPSHTVYDPNKTETVEVRIYDANPGAASFSLLVFDELEGRPLYSNSAQMTASTLNTISFSWQPQRAGYHVLSVKVEELEIFRHLVRVAPEVNFLNPGSQREPFLWPNRSQEPSSGDYHTIDDDFANGFYKLYVAANATIYGLNVYTTSIYPLVFFVYDGTLNTGNGYNIILQVPVTFRGVIEEIEVPVVSDVIPVPTSWANASVGIQVRYWDNLYGRHDCRDNACLRETFLIEHPIWKGVPQSFLQQAFGDYVSEDIIDLAEQFVPLIPLPGTLIKKFVVGAGLETIQYHNEVTNCDYHINQTRTYNVRIPVKNLQWYAISLMIYARAGAHYGGSAYVDFYDYDDGDCGGTREGFRMDQTTITHTLQ